MLELVEVMVVRVMLLAAMWRMLTLKEGFTRIPYATQLRQDYEPVCTLAALLELGQLAWLEGVEPICIHNFMRRR